MFLFSVIQLFILNVVNILFLFMPVIHITVNYFFPRGQIVTEIAHAWIVLTVHFQNFLGHKRWPHMFSLITHECEDKKLFY